MRRALTQIAWYGGDTRIAEIAFDALRAERLAYWRGVMAAQD